MIHELRHAFAESLHRGAMAIRGRGDFSPRKCKESSGSAQTISTTQNCAGDQQMPVLPLEVLIHQRAERVCNRNPALVAKYIRLQAILGRGR